MKKIFLFLLIGFFTHNLLAQTNSNWGSYYSYNSIKDVSQNSTNIFAVSENALFSKNVANNQIKIKNTIDGLSGQTITTMLHSASSNKTFIGYENGLIIMIDEVDGKIRQFIDIINKTIQPNLKRINHFYEFENKMYVSTDFGIVQFDLNSLEFGDTYFIGNVGAEISVQQITVFGGNIYAATKNNGIRVAPVNHPNLINYAVWNEIQFGWFVGISSVGNMLIAADVNGGMQKFNGANFQFFQNAGGAILDLRSVENYVVSTTDTKIQIFNNLGVVVQTIEANIVDEFDIKFTCATVIGTNIYAGTLENGIIIFPISNIYDYQFFAPAGPERNSVFSVNAQTENLWLTFGGFSSDYNPYAYMDVGLSKFGISKFSNNQWTTIPYQELLGARSLSRILVHPTNKNLLYVSSYIDGLLKIENDVAVQLYDNVNTGSNGLQSLTPVQKDIRVLGTAFDKAGNLWLNNARVNKAFKVLKLNNQWASYNVENIFSVPFELVYNDVVIDRADIKWFATYGGLVAFDDKTNVMKLISADESQGNLPSNDVRALAIDNRNQIWIGTNRGLRILSSTDRFSSDNALTTNPIIILEEGLAQELLYQQFITDIKVDGANNKWIGTGDAGVFHVSSDGQKILQQFNIHNSPLPSNSINEIDINPTTGEVFFATPKGLVSYKGVSTKGTDDLSNVIVYPNPVRPGYTGTVKITGLLDKANVKITDVQGNLVFETITEGGTIEWDTTAFGKYKVSTGVYMIFISSQDAMETKVKKVMIVR